MPRRKVELSSEEEVELIKLRRKKRTEAERQRRETMRTSKQTSHSEIRSRVHDEIQVNIRNSILPKHCQMNYRSRQKGYIDTSLLAIDNELGNEILEHYIGAMSVTCMHCSAKHFPSERVANKGNSFNECCNHGEVLLQPLPVFPTILQSLFNGSHLKSKNFFEHIRSYNSSFAFASFNANLVHFNSTRKGPFCFKIQGQIYYQINTALYPSSNEAPSYGQLFIVDSDEAVEFRLSCNSKCDSEIVKLIENVMREHNVYAQSYQMMAEELENQRSNCNIVNDESELHLLFTLKPGMDKNRYNFQRVNEVAAVFSTTADGDIPESYVTVRNKSDKSLQYVSTMDANVEPWIYPLFYPYGTRGWHSAISCTKKNRRVSRAMYTKYRMAVRDEFNPFLMGRRLFQQWLVDSYVKIEKDRIQFCKDNQKKLRAESYQGLIDHLEKRSQRNHQSIGKMVILPSTFQGSPRNMLQNYQDAMAIVRKYGKPDLFITMTCNPKWKEIRENLMDGQTAADRPDVVARVFNIKHKTLIDLIVNKGFFGAVQAYVYVIEFQKRGLPHMHMLVSLKQSEKITTPEVVDRYITAEIPKPEEQPILYDIVSRNMIHGPCGNWCLTEQNACSKHFPKHFNERTTLDEYGYPSYRRRNTGLSFKRFDGYIFNNQYVVPYNSTLLKLFNAHINVEVVSSVKSVKYLYKYIYKGHDAAGITIGETNNGIIDHDEIRDFIETRYVGPVEAAWRIIGIPLQGKSHSITRLPVHLPNQQNVVVRDDCDENEIRNALEKQTMLIDYFALNARDSQASQHLYGDIPSHYVFKKDVTGEYNWQRRQKQFSVIGRMYSVSPSQVELFHLRLLLLHRKGAKSFEDLKTINREVQDSYVTTCVILGLIEDDHEWKRAMNEAEIWMMPKQLRCLFARILMHCQPVHPEELWEEFKEAMSQDYERRYGSIEGQQKAYIQISSMLSAEGYNISMYPSMQQVNDTEYADDVSNDEQAIEAASRQYEHLNEKQKQIVDIILDQCDDDINESIVSEPPCFYIDGPGGSGKTYVYTTLYSLLKKKNKNICTMAYTGIAATLLPKGRTVHKTFGLPVPLFCDSTTSIKNNSKQAEYLKDVDVFIWDEAPVAPRYALDVIDRTLRDITDCNVPFGGKIMVLGGDFRQLLPVKVNATRSEIVNLSIKCSPLWQYFRQFSLTENMRALPNEQEFSKFLLDVGDGYLNDKDCNLELPPKCIYNFDIVENTFGTMIREKRFADLTKSAILSARNVDVEEINNKVVELLDVSNEKIYTSMDSVEGCDNGDINEGILPEYLNTLNPPNFSPHELKLRKNCIVMLIRNLNVNEGLCNGTRLSVLELGDNVIKCKIFTGDKSGDIVFIHRITLYCENVYPFTFKRRQFPIKIAFAMTINKSQGQTFDQIGIDLRKDVFTHGQLYVALSRVRSWESLKIYLGSQRKSNVVKNYVFKELYK
ncbi:hypothetical protein PPYR_00660 [Photinus pyralis]|uniref:ATP-dependent DNA helicase n=2 Tax=Photinus pyralis TaxID=7054 RepID=A0A1Y1LET3_PHOPY|nr:uncharacterized protein LOC116159285 [Photinus pyralis]XP_031343018.1 uncharacterized protein LOC116170652 [Photinus pyralis]KAB0792783.1 hypothetical protein PPYR_14742 [Photinus pyralis]KAB0803690.1 hypothetical protein PPYR_00660 [Photinus pyralis]